MTLKFCKKHGRDLNRARGERSHCRWDVGLSSPQICGSQVGQAAVAVLAMPWWSCDLGLSAMLGLRHPQGPVPDRSCHSRWRWQVLAPFPAAAVLTCPAGAPGCPSDEPSGAECKPPSAAGGSGTALALVALSHGCHCTGCTWTSACGDTDVTQCQCQAQHRLEPGGLRPALGVQPQDTPQRSPEEGQGGCMRVLCPGKRVRVGVLRVVPLVGQTGRVSLVLCPGRGWGQLLDTPVLSPLWHWGLCWGMSRAGGTKVSLCAWK